jgi:hypothetical protein
MPRMVNLSLLFCVLTVRRVKHPHIFSIFLHRVEERGVTSHWAKFIM